MSFNPFILLWKGWKSSDTDLENEDQMVTLSFCFDHAWRFHGVNTLRTFSHYINILNFENFQERTITRIVTIAPDMLSWTWAETDWIDVH
jgi:prephenate dehydrogenase